MGPHSGPYPTGDPNPTTAEQYEQAGQILGRIVEGKSISKIAQEFGVCRATIYNRLALISDQLPPNAAISYYVAHYRTKKSKGCAAGYPCRDCGGPALDWAYNHEDPDEMFWPSRGPYSASPDYYVPMCRACHRQFDTGWGAS